MLQGNPSELFADPGSSSTSRSVLGTLNTTVLSKKALGEAQFSLAVFSEYFGVLPYKSLAMTQQTATNFGQSWPMLVYLPITYLFDETQRHNLGIRDTSGYFTAVAPHEVAHQWWGHDVGFNSYRDQWMSEGFAEMSASLYIQFAYAKEPKMYTKFWNDELKLLTERNKEGYRPIDAGPVTMGYRLSNSREGFDITRRLIYPKGAYILHMLRMMMYDRQTADQRFKETMHDFVTTYAGRSATTEDFKAVVEKHMTAGMDLQGNHKMDWFFDEYVYGTQLPNYKFEYSFDPGVDGDLVLNMKLTQSGVNPEFRMLVPIYLELANGQVARLGSARPAGNMTVEQKVPLKGTKEKPKRAMINYYNDVLATSN
jgi:aminopeptidase N